MDSFNLTQSVTGPTHKHGHTLDLVLSLGFPVLNIELDVASLSDHKLVIFNASLSNLKAIF